jgi:hypothetical protein
VNRPDLSRKRARTLEVGVLDAEEELPPSAAAPLKMAVGHPEVKATDWGEPDAFMIFRPEPVVRVSGARRAGCAIPTDITQAGRGVKPGSSGGDAGASPGRAEVAGWGISGLDKWLGTDLL